MITFAGILFVCVAANHLGLIEAVEKVIGCSLPVVGCAKCLTFWVTLGYGCYDIATYGTIGVLAIAFLNAWLAVWLELGMGVVDKLYMKCYDTIYATEDDTGTADPNDGNSAGTVSEL